MKTASLIGFCSLIAFVGCFVACVSSPVKDTPGSIAVMTGGAAGAGGTAGTPEPTGTAGAADPTGAAGMTVDPTGVAGTTGTAGDAGSGVAGDSGAAGTTGTAGMTGTAGTTGAAGSGSTDAGMNPDVPVAVINPCDHKTWAFVPSVVCTTACANEPASQKLPANAIDGDTVTRYTTGISQGSKGPEVVILTFPKLVTLSGINLFSKNGDGPLSYLVEFSTDGANFSYFNPGSMGAGSDNLTVTFPAPTKLLALRITQTGVKKTNWWSIHELTVLGCAAAQ